MNYALVTGASGGIGLEIAKILASRGYSLILAARSGGKLEALKEEWEKSYQIRVQPFVCDLSRQEEVLKLFEYSLAFFPKILINNAGVGKAGYFTELSLKEDLAVLHTDVEAAHMLMKLYLQVAEEGYVLNTSSLAGFLPGPCMAEYGAAKSYLTSLSRSVNYELKRQGKKVSVSTLCPGPVRTGFDQAAGIRKERKGIFAFGSLSAEKCAEYAVNGMFKRKEIICPGTGAKLMHLFAKVTPVRILLPIEYRIQSNKLK